MSTLASASPASSAAPASSLTATPGAFEITLGILVLFWNLLSLLMRLQDRR